jgi:SAM-dependent methyltransferase
MKPLPALAATVTFLSAFLLFLVEPIAARQLLPLFGGSAAVWITCLVFFQCALLAGYLYAHLLATRLAPPAQAATHVVALAAAALGLAIPGKPDFGRPDFEAIASHPILSLLWLLAATIGVPFLVLAATSPLLQAWRTGGDGASRPPWWLYALSNGGSLLALLLYPTLVETNLPLPAQATLWRAGFCLFAVLCGGLALHRRRAVAPDEGRVPAAPLDAKTAAKPPATTAALWILLPACASMMLCAVTGHLGENVAAIPLLWILPLAVYLLSFVVAFASARAWPRFLSVRMLALTLATLAYLLDTSRSSLPLAISLPVYTAALFFACLYCHAEVYRLRPSGAALTRFYLLLSLGAALGAVWVGVVAPNLFHANHDLAIAATLLAATALAASWRSGWAVRLLWAAAAVALVYVGFAQAKVLGEDTLVQLRGFYGSLRVTETHLPPEAETTRTLYHGRIQHGTQLFGNGLRTQPSSYYARASGVGLALDLCCLGANGEPGPRRIGVVGLGTGTIAAYGRSGDEITFYEIDPLVERLARALFTYLRDSKATVRVMTGDARLSIVTDATAPPYDVLVLDAFSGDAIPLHLLTAQAIALYRRHLRPNGVLVIHISSQYVDLAPELALQARHAGLRAALVHSDPDEARGLFAADWVLMTADPELLSRPEIANAAQPLRELPGLRLWTDDYSSLLPLLKWRGASRDPVKP